MAKKKDSGNDDGSMMIIIVLGCLLIFFVWVILATLNLASDMFEWLSSFIESLPTRVH